MEKPNKKTEQEEGKMIAFRAPMTVAGQLDNAARITGKDRTFLILEAIKEHLGVVVERYGDEYQKELKKAQDEFMRSMKGSPPQPNTQKHTAESPSRANSGIATAKHRNRRKSSEFGKG